MAFDFNWLCFGNDKKEQSKQVSDRQWGQSRGDRSGVRNVPCGTCQSVIEKADVRSPLRAVNRRIGMRLDESR